MILIPTDMSRVFPIVTVFLFVTRIWCKAADPDLALSISIPHREGTPGVLRWALGDEPHCFHVILTNNAAKDMRIFQEWCSWGYGALFFELTDENGKTWRACKGPKYYTMNGPDHWTLKPHESYVFDVEYSNRSVWGDSFWLPPGHPTGRVTLKAFYAVNPDEASRKWDVWTGRITSEPIICVIK